MNIAASIGHSAIAIGITVASSYIASPWAGAAVALAGFYAREAWQRSAKRGIPLRSALIPSDWTAQGAIDAAFPTLAGVSTALYMTGGTS